MIRRVALTMSIAALACAMPYQRSGLRGGFEDFPMGDGIYVVTFNGNGFTSAQTVAMYLHYRCAELTVEAGDDAFAILQGADTSSVGMIATPGSSTTTTSGSVVASGNVATVNTTTHTRTVPAQAYAVVKPGRSAIIQTFRGDAPAGAFNAHEVMRLLGPRVGQ